MVCGHTGRIWWNSTIGVLESSLLGNPYGFHALYVVDVLGELCSVHKPECFFLLVLFIVSHIESLSSSLFLKIMCLSVYRVRAYTC